MSWFIWIFLTLVLNSNAYTQALLEKTYPLQSLYKIVIEPNICLTQERQLLICSQLKSELSNFNECSLIPTTNCSVHLLISFNIYTNDTYTKKSIYSISQTYPLNITNTPYTQLHVFDVNECREQTNLCSQNSICRNTIGTYRCQCLMGYRSPSRVNDGTVCLQTCQFKTCLNSGTCVPALNEADQVTCRCSEGYTGAHCEKMIGVDRSVIIVISTICGLAGVVGLALIIYAVYRVSCYKSFNITEEERSSLSIYKPSSFGDEIKPEYDVNDGKMTLRSTRSLSNTGGILSLRNDGLKFGRREWDELSSSADPTETLNPIQQLQITADIHKNSSVGSNQSMDYFA